MADKASLSGLRRSIRADLCRAGVDPSLTFDCLVAITEACTQVLLKGRQDGDEPAVTWQIDRSHVCFEVRETCSRAASKASHPSGRSATVAGTDAVGENLPLAVMKSLMDDVRVLDGPRGRTISLTKLIR